MNSQIPVPYRVVHSLASTRADHGGTSRSVPAVCRALQQKGIEIHLVTTVPALHEEEREPVLPGGDVKLHTVEEASLFRRLFRSPVAFHGELNRATADVDPSLIHDHGAWLPCNISAAWVARKHDLPLVVSPRGMVTQWALQHKAQKKRLAWHLYQKRVFECVDLFHVTARSEAESLRELGFEQPVAVVPNAVTVPSSLPCVSSEEEPNRLLFLSRIHPKKGLPALLDAWAQVAAPGWILELVGPAEGGHRHELEQKASRLGIADTIEFSGPIADAQKWKKYAAADLFVLPSHSENFGIVVAEALAAGVPVITTTGTPWKELAERNCGWWIDLSIDALATVLEEAMEASPERRRAMGRRGRALVAERYSWDRVAERMKRGYEWLLKGGPQPDFIV